MFSLGKLLALIVVKVTWIEIAINRPYAGAFKPIKLIKPKVKKNWIKAEIGVIFPKDLNFLFMVRRWVF